MGVMQSGGGSVAWSGLRQLACRFCPAASNDAHVVDPLVDLRFRFANRTSLEEMLTARGFKTDVAETERNYMRWWDAYSKVRALPKDSRDANLRRAMVAECEGLLGALLLPNDLLPSTPRDTASRPSKQPQVPHCRPEHVSFLRKAGMIKTDNEFGGLHTVGLAASLQYSLQRLFAQRFSASAVLVSPSHIVRGALLGAVNLSDDFYVPFTDGADDAQLYLTGHGLPSMLSLFVKTRLSLRGNEWPLRFVSSGAAYQRCFQAGRQSCVSLFDAPQRTKVALLCVCPSDEQEEAEFKRLHTLLHETILEAVQCYTTECVLSAANLLNYEAAAVSLVSKDGVQVGRVSSSGVYIPQRLNIVVDAKAGGAEATEFVRLIYGELDVSRLVGVVVEEHLMHSDSVPVCIRNLL